jgi:hypothetical protein
MKDFLTIVNCFFFSFFFFFFFFFDVLEMGKSLPLESDEKEKCMNVKTLPYVVSRRTRKVKRMRKVL